MRLVGALLTMEVALRVTARPRAVIVAAILAAEALDRRPSLQKRTVDREVLTRQKAPHLRLRHHRRQELRRDLAFQQPIPVLREARMVPRRIVNPKADEPAEQQVVLYSLHQQPLRADAVKRLKQHCP